MCSAMPAFSEEVYRDRHSCHATPHRAATVRESDGIALKRVFGERFVEARHPDLRALCRPLLEEIDRRRRAGAFDRRGRSPAVRVTMKTVGEPNAEIDAFGSMSATHRSSGSTSRFRLRGPGLGRAGRPWLLRLGRAAARPSSPRRMGSAHPSQSSAPPGHTSRRLAAVWRSRPRRPTGRCAGRSDGPLSPARAA